jgi:hypothetical protein
VSAAVTPKADGETEFGFKWGPLEVARFGEFPRNKGVERVVRVSTAYGAVDVYVSPSGKSIRVYRGTHEML